jgi:hypothetical protein
MNSNYLIYPCVLTNDQFEELRFTKEKLQEILDFQAINDQKRVDKANYYVGQIIRDLSELVSNHNSNGYRYNSYLLNMLCVKLSYVHELYQIINSESKGWIINLLSESNYTISVILEATNNENQSRND